MNIFNVGYFSCLQEDDAYGDQEYKRDKELFQQERQQQKFDRQL